MDHFSVCPQIQANKTQKTKTAHNNGQGGRSEADLCWSAGEQQAWIHDRGGKFFSSLKLFSELKLE